MNDGLIDFGFIESKQSVNYFLVSSNCLIFSATASVIHPVYIHIWQNGFIAVQVSVSKCWEG